MVQKSLHQLKGGEYSMIYRVLYIQTEVVCDFFHQQNQQYLEKLYCDKIPMFMIDVYTIAFTKNNLFKDWCLTPLKFNSKSPEKLPKHTKTLYERIVLQPPWLSGVNGKLAFLNFHRKIAMFFRRRKTWSEPSLLVSIPYHPWDWCIYPYICFCIYLQEVRIFRIKG